MSELEHLNVTVADTQASAEMLCDLFGWKLRWEGASIHNGYSAHVGSDSSYVALYTPDKDVAGPVEKYRSRATLNHIGVVVDDLDAVEVKVIARGYRPDSHADYEPGRRFYFEDENGLEIEVISYT
jgi:catechol 2,3-dioxygenase-like lactoylglutathione lyase family enzyme